MRQIIEEPLIDEDKLLFRGVPWGHVNYFWGDDKHKTYPNYINIIWQNGSVLRRSIIEIKKNYESYLENRCRREIQDISKQLAYYESLNRENGFSDRIAALKNDLDDQETYLQQLEYMRDVYIPRYLKLVEPLKRLDHFYIAV